MPSVLGSWPILPGSAPAMHAAALRAWAAAAPDVTKAASTPSRSAMKSPDFCRSSRISTGLRFASSIALVTFSVQAHPPSSVDTPHALMMRRTPSLSYTPMLSIDAVSVSSTVIPAKAGILLPLLLSWERLCPVLDTGVGVRVITPVRPEQRYASHARPGRGVSNCRQNGANLSSYLKACPLPRSP